VGGNGELPEGVERTELDGGVRVITDSMPSVRSVALGLWVRTGSRDEHAGQAGVSHFLEHLLFKGTERYSAIEISELFDGLGASTNAATGKESTHLYARLLDEHTEEAFDLLSEMLLGPTYPEVDSERQVVLEEIAMYEDEPQDRVHDVLADAVFGDHPLGRRVIGEAEVIASIPIPKIAAYHAERYVGPNIVVSAAGHVDHRQIVELAERHVRPPASRANGLDGATPKREPRMCFYEKKTEQYHVCLGAPGIPRGDDRRFALGVANAVLGGSTSSRLFREVREKRGLAYAVGSYSDEYIDNGLVATYVGTREDNVAEALDVIGRELASISADGVTNEELVRAKEHIKGRMVLGLESSSARMSRIARATMYDVPLLSLDEMLAAIDAVSLDDVAQIAAEFYAPERFSAACVGTDEALFRRALEPVSPALAA
jgi:predicted Zn-dependent peptidase